MICFEVADNETITDYESSTITYALSVFHEYYNLAVDGQLNSETLDLMNSWCGVSDDVSSFSASKIVLQKKLKVALCLC